MHFDATTAGVITTGIVTLGGIAIALIKQKNFIEKSDTRHVEKMSMAAEHVAVVGEFVTALARVEGKVDAQTEPMRVLLEKVDFVQRDTLILVDRSSERRKGD